MLKRLFQPSNDAGGVLANIPWPHLFIMLVAAYFLFFFQMGARDLWSPDEPRYAQVAREMLRSGDWIVPHLNDEIYTEKPPLYFWLVALLSKPFGDVNETTARLPSALAAALVMLVTYALGSSISGRRDALLGTLVMATSAQFVWVGRIGVIDMLLALCILAALCLFYAGYARRAAGCYLLGFLFLAPAALAKGPVGIAAPVVVMLSFLVVETALRQEGAKRELLRFCCCMLLGLALVAFIVAPWWRAAHERSGGVYGSLSILLEQTRGRMVESYSHRQPVFYYFYNLIWQLFPWTVFLPLTARSLWKQGDLRAHRGLRFLLVWFASIFIFFTLISGKRSQYIMPLFPAAGLLAGWALAQGNPLEGMLKERKDFQIPLIVLLIISFAALVAFPVASHFYLRNLFAVALALAFAGAPLLFLLAWQMNSRPPIFALKALLIFTAIAIPIAFGCAMPEVDTYKSARPFCAKVLTAAGEADPILFYQVYRPNINYYMGRSMKRLETRRDVWRELEGRQRVFLVLENKRLQQLSFRGSVALEQVARDRIGSREIVCVKVSRAQTGEDQGNISPRSR